MLLLPGALGAQAKPAGSLDPLFSIVPFDSWFSDKQTKIRWTSEVPDAVLSIHQRLQSDIRITIDGRDLAPKGEQGGIAVMVQLRDQSGALWQNHGVVDLGKVNAGGLVRDVQYIQAVFLLPGDYEASFAIVDTRTGEHNTARKKFHVGALRSEPLPNAWKNLPAVEFIRSAEQPDAWYLPEIPLALSLTAHPKSAATVDIVVNTTPTDRLSGSARSRDRGLSVLLPVLKLLVQTDWGGAALRVTFLDLGERKTLFDQREVRQLNWQGVKDSMADATPGLVDVKALENHRFAANFFNQEVGRRIDRKPADPKRIVIVLSTPVSFENGVERHQIEAAASPDVHVYYIRYHPYTPSLAIGPPEIGGFGRRGAIPTGNVVYRPAPGGSADDQLASLLKPIRPELFDVLNPEQFRKALATILESVSGI